MKIPIKTINNDFSLPVYGFGANRSSGSDSDVDVIRKTIEYGITHFDTAESYAGGSSEITIGKAIKGYKREDLIIATKVSPVNLKYNELLKAARNSLKRLDTDYIDLYMIHFPNENTPISETMKAMDQLLEDNIIRYIGVSNFNIEQFKEAQKYSENKIVINQVPYSLINRKFQLNGFLDYANKNDIMVSCWWPLEYGRLAYKGIGLLDKVCTKYNKTPAQVAINWLISQKNMVTMAGTQNIDHLKENLGSFGWHLEKEDIDLLNKSFPIKENTSIAEDYWNSVLE